MELENAYGVPQLHNEGLLTCPGELARRSIVEAAVRAHLVVLRLP